MCTRSVAIAFFIFVFLWIDGSTSFAQQRETKELECQSCPIQDTLVDDQRTKVKTIADSLRQIAYDLRNIDLHRKLDDLKRMNKISRKDHTVPLLTVEKTTVEMSQRLAKRKDEFPFESPANYTRFQVASSAAIKGIPVVVNGFRTTEQNALRLPMNYFTIQIDAATVQRNIKGKIRERTKILEKQTIPHHVDDLSQLGKVLKDSRSGIESVDQLKEVLHQLANDSIAKADSLQRAKDRFQQRKNAFQEQYADSIKHITSAKADTLRALRGKISDINKLNSKKQELLEYLKKHPALLQQVKRGIALRDSLEEKNPVLLEKYDSLLLLKGMEQDLGLTDLKKLRQAKLISHQDLLLQHIKKVQVGTCFPDYSLFTLRGLPVQGIDVELEVNKWHVGFVGSKKLPFSSKEVRLANKVTAFRFGKGDQLKTHGNLIFLQGEGYGRLTADSVFSAMQDTLVNTRRGRNVVVGMEAQWNITKSITAHASWARSIMTPLGSERASTRMLFSPVSASSSTDSLWKGDAFLCGLRSLLTKTLSIEATYKKIDPRFYSIGTPFLRNDIKSYEVKASKQFFDGKFTVSPFIAQYTDNLNSNNADTLTAKDHGITIQWNSRKLLIHANLFNTSIVQKQNKENTHTAQQDNIMNTVMTARYNYSVGTTQCLVQINGTLSMHANETWNVNAIHALVFPNSLTIQNTLSYIESYSGFNNRAVNQGAFTFVPNTEMPLEQWWLNQNTISFRCWGKWSNSIVCTYGFGMNNAFKKGLQWRSSYCPFKNVDFSFIIDRTHVKSERVNFEELAGTLSLQYSF